MPRNGSSVLDRNSASAWRFGGTVAAVVAGFLTAMLLWALAIGDDRDNPSLQPAPVEKSHDLHTRLEQQRLRHDDTHQVVRGLREESQQLERQRDELAQRLAESYLGRGLDLADRGDVEAGLRQFEYGLRELSSMQGRSPLTAALRANLDAWSRQTTTRVLSLDNAQAAVLSHDGRTVVVADETQLRGRHLSDGKELKQLPRLEEMPRRLSFSSDDRRLLIQQKSTVLILDVATGTSRARLAHAQPVALALFSPHGRHVATATQDGTVTLWDAETGKVRRSLQREGPVRDVVFSPEGELVLVLTNREVRLWEIETGKIAGRPLVHSDRIDHVVIARDGSLAATAGTDGSVRVWKVPSGVQLGGPLKLPEAVRAFGFTRDGRFLVAVTSGRLQRWSIPQLHEVGTPLRPIQLFGFVSLSPDAARVALEERGRLVIRNTLDGERLGEVRLDRASVHQLGWSAAGGVLLALVEQQALVWRLPQQSPISRALPSEVVLEGATLTADGNTLLTWGGGRFWLFDLERHRLRAGPVDLKGATSLVQLSPSGQVIVAAGRGRPRGWDGDGKPIPGYEALPTGTWSVGQFSPAGGMLLLATDEGAAGRALLIRPETGELLRPLEVDGGLGPVKAVGFSANGKLVMTAGTPRGDTTTGEAHVWSADSGVLSESKRVPHPARAVAVPWIGSTKDLRSWTAPDAARPLPSPAVQMTVVPETEAVAVACRDGTVLVADRTLRLKGEPTVLALDGDLLAVAAGREVRLCHARTGWPVGPPLSHSATVKALAFHATPRELITLTSDGVLRRWPLGFAFTSRDR